MKRVAVDYANAYGLTLGTPAVWVADQLHAEGFRHVEVVDALTANADQWDALQRTFRWSVGLPFD